MPLSLPALSVVQVRERRLTLHRNVSGTNDELEEEDGLQENSPSPFVESNWRRANRLWCWPSRRMDRASAASREPLDPRS